MTHTGRGLEKVPKEYRYENAFEVDRNDKLIAFVAQHSILCLFKDRLYPVINSFLGYKMGSIYKQYDKRIFDYVSSESNIEDPEGMMNHYDWFISESFETMLDYSSPKFVYLQNLVPHFPYKYNENGLEVAMTSTHDLNNYMPQHRYAAKIMMGMVNHIIEKDPDAVIIIQGDHGVHGFQRVEMKGFNDEQMLAMNFSTVSAVRIPEKYGILAEPLDPVDISRYLVNHFVGKDNYEYIYYKGE